VIIGCINKTFSKLPRRWNGLHLEDSHYYCIINPCFLRGEQSVPYALLFGQEIFELISVHVPLNLGGSVLDVGCGDGRLASAFVRGNKNKFHGIYAGFDVDPNRIKALKQLLRTNDNFSFIYADIFHPYYNTKGTIQPDEYRFEYPDESFDLVIFNSIFTHIRLKTIERNLREAYRCLKPGGKVWATFYLIDQFYNPKYKGLKWHFNWKCEEGFTAVHDTPSSCMAYPIKKVGVLCKEIGFSIEKYIIGYWKIIRRTLDNTEQDVLILRKPDGME